jgi:hypothetical protein
MVATLGPQWFLSTEIVFDTIFTAITAIVTFVGFRAYTFFKDERHKLHSTGFLFLSGAYLMLTLTNLILLFELREVKYTLHHVAFIQNITTIGWLLFALLTLIGLTFLLIVYLQVTDKTVRALLFILVLFGVLFSDHIKGAFFLFIAVLLLFIVIKLAKNYGEKRKAAALLVLLGFCALFIGQVVLSVLFVNETGYVIAGILNLLGYLMILGSLVVR